MFAILLVNLNACDGAGGARHAQDFFSDPQVAALADAAAQGDLSRIDALIAQGVNLNAQGKKGMTVLQFSMHGSKKGYQRLLEQGADPNQSGMYGEAAIHYATGFKDTEFLKLALAHGANPNLTTPTSPEPILQAILFGTKEHIQVLIDAGANLNVHCKGGDPPITHAANINAFDIVYLLLEAGADYTIQDDLGYTVTRPILTNNIDPQSEQGRWHAKVKEFLAARGVDFAEEQRKIDAIREVQAKKIQAVTQEIRKRAAEERRAKKAKGQ